MKAPSPDFKALRLPIRKIDHWLAFTGYLVILAVSISAHEPWGDELHSWNIAKGSRGYFDLVHNTRYEGHPPLWYTFLFVVCMFTHDPFYMQGLHFVICAATAFILVFYSRLPITVLVLMLSGYYFIFEYAVLSRNYSLGVLFAFLICMVLNTSIRHKSIVYYIFLFLLSNTHFLGLILAVCFHVYFLQTPFLKKKAWKMRLFHLLLGIIVFLPSVVFIFPPANSSLNPGFWLSIWNGEQYLIALQVMLKAIVPLPMWYEYHFWNTNYITDLLSGGAFLKMKTFFISFVLYILIVFVLWKDKRSLWFFTLNVIFTSLVAFVFPLVTSRYVGFIFIGFVAALWLSGEANNLDPGRKIVLALLLLFQIPGGIIALKKDWVLPFSQVPEVENILGKTADQPVITDYWALNYISAVVDKPFYCIGFNREKSFLLWDNEMSLIMKRPNIYTEGITGFLKEKNAGKVFLLSNNSRDQINERDSSLFKLFEVELVTEKRGAIEKYSDLYLYRVIPRRRIYTPH